jgi:hypothetical protein
MSGHTAAHDRNQMEIDVSFTIARTGAFALQGLGPRALRAVAIALLTVGLQAPVSVAAAGGVSHDSTAQAVRAPMAAIATTDAGSEPVLFEDDGEDSFDEGDDEFGCADVRDAADACADDGEDRDDDGEDSLDEVDDASEAGCTNFDDGEDRCLDGGDLTHDQSIPTTDQPLPTHASIEAASDARSVAAPPDQTRLAGLAAFVALGAGGLWLIRRAMR